MKWLVLFLVLISSVSAKEVLIETLSLRDPRLQQMELVSKDELQFRTKVTQLNEQEKPLEATLDLEIDVLGDRLEMQGRVDCPKKAGRCSFQAPQNMVLLQKPDSALIGPRQRVETKHADGVFVWGLSLLTESARFRLPSAGQVVLHLPQGDFDFQTALGTRLPTSQPLRLMGGSELQLTRRKAGAEQPKQFSKAPSREFVVEPHWEFEVRPYGIHLRAIYRVFSLNAGVRSFELPKQEGAVLRKVETHPASRVQVKDHRLHFLKPMPNPFELRLDWGLPPIHQSNTLPLPLPSDMSVREGKVRLRLFEGMRLLSQPKGLLPAPSSNPAKWPLVYRLPKPQSSFTLEAEKLKALKVRPYVIEQVKARSLCVGHSRVATQLKITLLSQTRQDYRLPLPKKAVLKGVFVEDRSVKAFMQDGDVVVPMRSGVDTRYEVEIQYEQHLSTDSGLKMSLPDAYGEASGVWSILWPEGLEIEDLSSTVDVRLPAGESGSLDSYESMSQSLRVVVLLLLSALVSLGFGFALAWATLKLVRFSWNSAKGALQSLKQFQILKRLSWLWGLLLILVLPVAGLLLVFGVAKEAGRHISLPSALPSLDGPAQSQKESLTLDDEFDAFGGGSAQGLQARPRRESKRYRSKASRRNQLSNFAMSSAEGVAAPPAPQAGYVRKGNVKAVRQKLPEFSEGIRLDFSEGAGRSIDVGLSLKEKENEDWLQLRGALLGLMAASFLGGLLFRFHPLPYALCAMAFLWWSTSVKVAFAADLFYGALIFILLMGALILRFGQRYALLGVGVLFFLGTPTLKAEGLEFVKVYEVFDPQSRQFIYEDRWAQEPVSSQTDSEKTSTLYFAEQTIQVAKQGQDQLRVSLLLHKPQNRGRRLLALPAKILVRSVQMGSEPVAYERVVAANQHWIELLEEPDGDIRLDLQTQLRREALLYRAPVALARASRTRILGSDLRFYAHPGLENEGDWYLPEIDEVDLVFPLPGYVPARNQWARSKPRPREEPSVVCRYFPKADQIRQICTLKSVAGLKLKPPAKGSRLLKVEVSEGRRRLEPGQDYGHRRAENGEFLEFASTTSALQLEVIYTLKDSAKNIGLPVMPPARGQMNLNLEPDPQGRVVLSPNQALRKARNLHRPNRFEGIEDPKAGFVLKRAHFSTSADQGSRVHSIQAHMQLHGLLLQSKCTVTLEPRGDRQIEFDLPDSVELVRLTANSKSLKAYAGSRAGRYRARIPQRLGSSRVKLVFHLEKRLEAEKWMDLGLLGFEQGAYRYQMELKANGVEVRGLSEVREGVYRSRRMGALHEVPQVRRTAQPVLKRNLHAKVEVEGLRLQLILIGLSGLLAMFATQRSLIRMGLYAAALVQLLTAQASAVFVLPLALTVWLTPQASKDP